MSLNASGQGQPPLRLVVFDWDGTLMDSVGRIVASMQQAIDSLGLPQHPPEVLANVIGLGLKEALADLYPGQDEGRLEALVQAYRQQFLGDNTVPQRPFAGARDSLVWLQGQGVTMAVATGKGRRGLDQVMDEIGFREFFADSRCADETASKPDPLMLQELMDGLGVEPAQTLMVGDTEYDMEMAARAGAHALAASYGVHDRERLQRWPLLGFLDDIADLPRWWQARHPGTEAR